MKLSMIVAIDAKMGIGKDNSLPWPHSKEDMSWFVRNTRGKAVLMGSRTWDSLPTKPLPNRTNFVVTTSNNSYGDNTLKAESAISALDHVRSSGVQECVIIGGAKTYREFMPFVEEVHVTKFNKEYECDTFLDVYSMIPGWLLVYEQVTDNLTFQTWRKP